MRNKEDLKTFVEIVMWQIKGMKGYFFIPLYILYVIQPVYIFLVLWVGYGFKEMYIYDEITSAVMGLYPPLSLWWTLWVLKKYLEDDERELYYVDRKTKWMEVFTYYFLYTVASALILLIYSIWIGMGQSVYLLLCTAAMGFFYHAFAYWFAYLTKSASIVLIPLLIYTFWVMSPYQYQTSQIRYTRLFYDGIFKGILWSFAFFLLGVIFIKMGKWENRKYNTY
ncbi:MAG: hypothetical protein J1F41_00670 [Lachnospiraceae bacterium]|nr:hypothetical protein [Lachnospiraceae bacterium]